MSNYLVNTEQFSHTVSECKVEMRFSLCSQNQWLDAIDFGGASLRREES